MEPRGKTLATLMRKSADVLEQRAAEYAGQSDMFDEISQRSGLSLDEVFKVLIAVKEARLSANPKHHDSLVDLINYTGFKYLVQYGEALTPQTEEEDTTDYVRLFRDKHDPLYQARICVDKGFRLAAEALSQKLAHALLESPTVTRVRRREKQSPMLFKAACSLLGRGVRFNLNEAWVAVN